jgi:hypothetical protein
VLHTSCRACAAVHFVLVELGKLFLRRSRFRGAAGGY